MWAVETYTLWLPIDLWTSWKIEPKKEVVPDVKKIEPKKEVVPDVKKDMSFNLSKEEEDEIRKTQEAQYKEYFDRTRWESTQDYERAKLDIDRLIQYTNTDYTKQLAQDNKIFARSLDKATNVYWQRWLLWSWIQKSQAWEATDDYSKSLQNAEEYRKRKIEWYETQWQNIKTKYDRWMRDIWEQQQAQTYFDTIKEIRWREAEFYRRLWQEQKSPWAYNIKTTWPTTPHWNTLDQTDVLKINLNY